MRDYIKQIEVLDYTREADPRLEIPRILREEHKAFHFKNIKSSDYSLIGNICNSRSKFARALGVDKQELITKLNNALEYPTRPKQTSKGACQQVIEEEVDLTALPIPTYTSSDMGPYITSAVYITSDPEYGFNMSFHRASPISKNKLVARLCKRDLYEYLKRAGGELKVALCIGVHPAILLAAALSTQIEQSELDIANTLGEFRLVKCIRSDLLVPANSEIILEGKITRQRHTEGPFLDVTRTLDKVRKEPVIEIELITHRKNPIYHAILPSLREHQLLMGMPREPIIYNQVSRVCACRGVHLSSGGCGWLHGIVSIEKNKPDDAANAIRAAFRAHKSMKHLVLVDSDINVYDKGAVEWAIATRYQGDVDTHTFKEKGSSLDPSCGKDNMTTKIGLDATIPSKAEKKMFREVRVGE